MKNNFYISFGVWIIILPFLGVPGTWRNTLVFLSGLFLVLTALGPTILKKLQTKPKTKKTNLPNPPYIKEGEEKKEELKFSNFPSPDQGEGRVGSKK